MSNAQIHSINILYVWIWDSRFATAHAPGDGLARGEI
jgi:hypothetical protein